MNATSKLRTFVLLVSVTILFACEIGYGRDAFVWTREGGMTLLENPEGSDGSSARAINNAGLIVGGSGSMATIWDPLDNYAPMQLGTLGGRSGSAGAVNDNGIVVGWAYTAAEEQHAFSWTSETGIVDLGTLGGTHSSASNLNNAGNIVGSSRSADEKRHACLWEEGSIIDLSLPAWSYSSGCAINNVGQILINYTLEDGTTGTCLREPGGLLLDIPSPTGCAISGRGINDDGVIAGRYRKTTGPWVAFQWTEEEGLIDLGTLGGNNSEAIGINAHGEILLWAQMPDKIYHPAMWTAAGGIEDLHTGSPEIVCSPSGFNDDCVMVGLVVPEPATLALLAIGGLALFRRRRITGKESND